MTEEKDFLATVATTLILLTTSMWIGIVVDQHLDGRRVESIIQQCGEAGYSYLECKLFLGEI